MAKDGLKICSHKRYFHFILHLCEPFSGISTNWKIWIKWRIWKRKEWRGGLDRWRMEDECSGWRPCFSTSSFFSSPPCQWRAGGPLFYPTWQLAFLGTSQFFGVWDVVIWGVHIFYAFWGDKKAIIHQEVLIFWNISAARFHHLRGWNGFLFQVMISFS